MTFCPPMVTRLAGRQIYEISLAKELALPSQRSYRALHVLHRPDVEDGSTGVRKRSLPHPVERTTQIHTSKASSHTEER